VDNLVMLAIPGAMDARWIARFLGEPCRSTRHRGRGGIPVEPLADPRGQGHASCTRTTERGPSEAEDLLDDRLGDEPSIPKASTKNSTKGAEPARLRFLREVGDE